MSRFKKQMRMTAGVLLAILALSVTALAQSIQGGETSSGSDTGSPSAQTFALPDKPPAEADTTPVEPEPLPEPEPASSVADTPALDSQTPRGQMTSFDGAQQEQGGTLSTGWVLVLGAGVTVAVLLVGIMGGRRGRMLSKQL